MEENDLFNNSQHGFRKCRSCLSQLIEQHAEVLEAMCQGSAVDVVYLDFAKAFDKVDHGLLIKKLVNMGICGNLLKWIKTFLTKRIQKVEVNHSVSEESEVISGVPQGSVLGPLLFIIFISDIDDGIIESRLSSFADDTRVLKFIRDMDDCDMLQRDLQAICDWVQDNNMRLNEDKFEALRCGRHPAQQIIYKTGTGMNIEFKNEVKDLGVQIQNDGKSWILDL